MVADHMNKREKKRQQAAGRLVFAFCGRVSYNRQLGF
jgi:hypothetical protein